MPIDVDQWCCQHLGAGVVAELFSTGHLSSVSGVRLSDGREVVVKARPFSARLVACAEVQRSLQRAGFPAPELLAGPITVDSAAVTAETFVPGGDVAPPTTGAAPFAGLLARLIHLAPAVTSVGSLAPNPAWVAWDHDESGIWPTPDDRDVDLNAAIHATPWLDAIGDRVRDRLAKFSATAVGQQMVIGHGDWEAQNLRWSEDQPWAVHDWDSIMCGPEAVIVGCAASVWPCGIHSRAATVAESAEFIEAYQSAAERVWSADEVEASWAAGLWVYAFNAKKASLDDGSWLTPDGAAQRLRLSGAQS